MSSIQTTDDRRVSINLFEVKKISKQINGKILFSDLSFELEKNSILYVAGKSGSGKSQLLKAMALLAPVDFGEIKFNGQVYLMNDMEKNGRSIPQFRAQVQYVPQNPIFFPGRVINILESSLRLNVYKYLKLEVTINKFRSYLKFLNLSENLLNCKIETLSGGERAAILLIRTLILNPRVLLLDEPVSAMDFELKNKTIELIKDYIINRGGTAIIVTHDSAISISDSSVLHIGKDHIEA